MAKLDPFSYRDHTWFNDVKNEFTNDSSALIDSSLLEIKTPKIKLPVKCIIILKDNTVIQDIEVEDISYDSWSRNKEYSFLLKNKGINRFGLNFTDSYLVLNQKDLVPFKYVEYGDIIDYSPDIDSTYNNIEIIYKPCPPKEILPVLQATGLIKIEEELCSKPIEERDEMEEIRKVLIGPSLLDIFKDD